MKNRSIKSVIYLKYQNKIKKKIQLTKKIHNNKTKHKLHKKNIEIIYKKQIKKSKGKSSKRVIKNIKKSLSEE